MSFHSMLPHGRDAQFFSAVGYGSRQPLKVLCDGTFIHHIVVNGIRIEPPYDAISNLLGASAVLLTTRCIISELRSLGESHLGSCLLADTLITARCSHATGKSAVSCIIDIARKHNQEHFYVATMDADLRKKLREIPGVLVVFGFRNGLFLEQPSEFQRTFVKSSEEECLRMTEPEFNILDKGAENMLTSKEVKGSSNADERDQILTSDDVRKTNVTTKKHGVKGKAQFRRREVKEWVHGGKAAQNNIKKRKKATNKKKKKTTVVVPT